MKVVLCTSPSGSDRRQYLSEVKELAEEEGHSLQILYDWDALREVDPSADERTFLNVQEPIRLARLEKAFNKIRSRLVALAQRDYEVAIIATHGVFPWKGAYVDGFPADMLDDLRPDVLITVVANVLDTYERLRSTPFADLTRLDVLSWRDEEHRRTQREARRFFETDDTLNRYFLVARHEPPSTLYRILFRPELTRFYVSYPMSHVPEEKVAEAKGMIASLRDSGFIAFDPDSIFDLRQARTLKARIPEEEIPELVKQMGNQIVRRDFALIDQSNCVAVYYASVPYTENVPGGTEARLGENIPLSAGVISEMVHAHRAGKVVYTVWLPTDEPSPFFNYHCHKRFKSIGEFLDALPGLP